MARGGFLLSVGRPSAPPWRCYQWGWLGGVLGVDTPGAVLSFLPIILIGVLFGLAMDYQVFLVSGMRESCMHGRTRRMRCAPGSPAASKVVTAAAIIMSRVFAGLRLLAPE